MLHSRKQTETARRREVERLQQMLCDGIEQYLTSENYHKYLACIAKFHQYSARNAMLITMQNPEATAVASFMDWKIKFHRHVKPGEHGIRIIAPITRRGGEDDEEKPPQSRICGFRTATIFDISQTEGEPLPELTEDLTGAVPDFDALRAAACSLTDFEIVTEALEADIQGKCQFSRRRIVISPDMSEAMTMKTLIHEISHAKMHAAALHLPRQVREIQAESVAYIVCAHLGIDAGQYSFGYLVSWGAAERPQFFEAAMPAVVRTAGELIQGFDRFLQRRTDPRARGLETPAAGSLGSAGQ